MTQKNFKDLRSFITHLESSGQLKRVSTPVSMNLEVTEISDRVLKKNGPALIFENATKLDGKPSQMPVLTNLFGSKDRILAALGMSDLSQIRELGKILAFLRQPEPPNSIKDAIEKFPILKKALQMKPKTVSSAPCQEIVLTGNDIDINLLPIQKCWPEDVAGLITWPLVVTKGPDKHNREDSFNLGIYRMQPLDIAGEKTNKLIMRWLKHRGGAMHHNRWSAAKSAPLPAALVFGAPPAVTLAAVTPVPDSLSEYEFSGLLSDQKAELVNCKTIDLKVPAYAEIVVEGHVSLAEYAPEGPYGDHTGFYNATEPFPVFTISAITMRKNPIYHTTYTTRPPDECSVLGECLNELFIPLFQQQFSEVVDFWLPPEACSYRVAVVSIKKTYAGQAKRIMMGVWSFLRQFMYTKFIIVVDHDINARNWNDVIWAISTNVDASRDITIIDNTPIDYLDFASIEEGLGGKMGIDATTKIAPETKREWGVKITQSPEITELVNQKWSSYEID